LYGTCTIFSPVARLSISPRKCEGVPAPYDAKLTFAPSLPCVFAQATNSASVVAGTALWIVIASSKLAALTIGTKSRTGS